MSDMTDAAVQTALGSVVAGFGRVPGWERHGGGGAALCADLAATAGPAGG